MVTKSPVQLLSPIGSSVGQVLRSTGPSSNPIWANSESVSVLDYGADNTGVVDSTAAIQAAINAANARGANCNFPGGTYKCSSGLVLDNSSDATQTGLRTNLIAPGPHSVILNFGAGAYNCITMTGSNTNGGADSFQRCENIFINKSDNLGKGFVFSQHSHLRVTGCRVNGTDTGIYCQDVQESSFYDTCVTFANGGFVAIAQVAFTGFNGVNFVNCKFGNNNKFGVDLQNVACVNFFGGSIESNISTTAGQVTWGVRWITTSDATLQGTSGLNLWGTYIENNGYAGTPTTTNADVWIVNSTSPSVSNIQGCTFQRHAAYCTNNIRVDASGSASQVVNIVGNGFRGYSDYTANAARPYWNNTSQALVTINALGNKQQNSVETVAETDYILGTNLTGVALTTGQVANVSSLLLNPGDWEVSGNVVYHPAGTTTTSGLFSGVSTTSATLPADSQMANLTWAAQVVGNTRLPSPTTRIKVTVATTVYLVTSSTFATSTATADGYLRARRLSSSS